MTSSQQTAAALGALWFLAGLLALLPASAAARLPKALDANQLAAQAPPASGSPGMPAAAAAAGGCADCSDAAPPGGSAADCTRLRDSGSCYSTWMVAADACALTCGRCTPCFCSCTDVPPDAAFSCAQQAAWGKCGEAWMLRLFCQQSCRRCACPISGAVSVPALSLPTGGGGALAVTAAGEPAAGAAVAAAPPTAAATDGASAPAATATAANLSQAANSSMASPPPAASETPQQQLVDPLFDALASLAPANGTGNGGGGVGPGGCRTDVLNFLRSAPDLSLYLSLAVLTGWQHAYLANASLAATLLLPSDTAVRAFLQQQRLTPENVYALSDQLESLLAYHTLPQPLTYTELTQASTRRASLLTELPGAFLEAQPVNATALRLSGEYSSAALLRTNVALCRTVVHVLDAVLLPTRTIQQVQPFSVAIDKGSVEASPSTTSGSSGGSGGSGSSSTGLAGGNSSGGGGSNSSSDQTSPAAAAASLEAAWRSPAQDTPAAAGPGGCYRSIAAAIDASPQLTIDKTIAFLAGWDLSHPGLNVTLFLPSDSAQQMALAGLMQSDGGTDSQTLVALARDSRLLHASLAYGIVAGSGGLPLEALQQAPSRKLPTLFTNHSLGIQAGGQNGSVQVQPEFGNATRIVQSLRSCGGSVIHIVDGPLTARTPLVERWTAGQPPTNLSEATAGYSPEQAQAAVDATAMGAASGSGSSETSSSGSGGSGSSGGATSPAAASGGSPSLPASAVGVGDEQTAQHGSSSSTDPVVALSLLRPGGTTASWSSQPAAGSSSSPPSDPAQLALNLSLSLPLQAAAAGQPAAQLAPAPSAAPSPAAPAPSPAASALAASPPLPSSSPPVKQVQPKSASATAAAGQLAAAGSVPVPPLPPLAAESTWPAALPPAPATAPAPVVEATSGAPADSSGGAEQPANDADCVTLRAVVETSPQIFSRARDLVARFGWFAATPQLDSNSFLLPTDAALEAFTARFNGSTLQAVLASPQALRALASYHVLEDRVTTGQLYDGQQLPTLARDAQGKPLSLTVHRSGPAGTIISLQGAGSSAGLLVPDIPVCGGIIQVIDQVLLPVEVPAAATAGAASPPAAPPGGSGTAGAAAVAG